VKGAAVGARSRLSVPTLDRLSLVAQHRLGYDPLPESLADGTIDELSNR
jgi:hypothetical protein